MASHLAAPVPLHLRLYVAGTQPQSLMAVQTANEVCSKIPGCSLEVIDIYRTPEMMKNDNIIVVPVLLRVQPPPPVRILGCRWELTEICKRLGLPS